ncbi:glyoxal reductase [Chlorella sorokiniana]|uniref:Glyoxal reductase n=1 Tax=Chlorella sorokiniana TaxID=3076 RepID=A0A2P6TDY8_CHLSO|nr:glyoxal reductase [Chlorella sorokiniana]|eukprot:PRW20855.1 glyoxal reductase [Chlorella sorokiniana]
MARRRSASRSLVGYGTVLAVLLLAPTLVVLTFIRSLPDSSSSAFKKHAAGSGSSGGSRAAGRPGPRLHDQLDDARSAGGSTAAKGAWAASLHADAGLQQQQQQAEEPRRGAGGAEAEQQQQQQAQQTQQQQQQEQQQQQQQQQGGQQVRQGQVARGQAPVLPAEQPNPQQHAARKQRYAAKKAQQAQQQLQPATVYTGTYPRWPSVLPKGSGKPQALPGCKDKDSQQLCAAWARQGDCDTNPGYMYFHCAAACGLCQAVYLHGNETLQQVEVAPGVLMPTVGYGTAGLVELTADAVFTAIRIGYRLVDSAEACEWYQEDLVGWGWRASGIKREHLFITTKLHPRHHGYWTTLEMFAKSLRELQTDYIDMMLLHYPECWGSLCSEDKPPEGTWQDSWFALEQLVREGKLRAAGVSNFNLDQMRELVQIAEVKPAVLQANSDLLTQNRELQAFCRRHGILLQAYSSMGGQYLMRSGKRNPVLAHPAVVSIAQRLGRTPGQVVLRWALQHGQAVIPRTSRMDRMKENLDLFSFNLTDQDMLALDALDGSPQSAGGSSGSGSSSSSRKVKGGSSSIGGGGSGTESSRKSLVGSGSSSGSSESRGKGGTQRAAGS